MVANSQEIARVGKCHRVSIQIQGYKLQTKFNTLLLDGIDVLFGVKWLMQLRTYATDLQQQFMKRCKWQGEIWKLFGLKPFLTKKSNSQPLKKINYKRAPTKLTKIRPNFLKKT